MSERGGHRVEPAPHRCIDYFVANHDTHAADQRRIDFDLRVYLAPILLFERRNQRAHLMVRFGK